MKTRRQSLLKRAAIFSLVVFSSLSLQRNTVTAQTPEAAKPTSEVEQLKVRLQQLEQTVIELKGQLNAIEETKKKSATPAIVTADYSESTKPVDSSSAAQHQQLRHQQTQNRRTTPKVKAPLKSMALQCSTWAINSNRTILIGST